MQNTRPFTLTSHHPLPPSLSLLAFMSVFAHLSRLWSIGWVALSFLVRLLSVRPAMVTSDQISTFSIYTGIKALYWPSFTKYQAVSSYTDPALPSTNQYRSILTQHHQLLTSAAFYGPCSIMYQPVTLHIDPVPPSTNQYRLLLTQFHQVPTSTVLYWHSTIIYQPVPFYTDPVLQSTNQYRPILTQYRNVSTSTTL